MLVFHYNDLFFPLFVVVPYQLKFTSDCGKIVVSLQNETAKVNFAVISLTNKRQRVKFLYTSSFIERYYYSHKVRIILFGMILEAQLCSLLYWSL